MDIKLCQSCTWVESTRGLAGLGWVVLGRVDYAKSTIFFIGIILTRPKISSVAWHTDSNAQDYTLIVWSSSCSISSSFVLEQLLIQVRCEQC